MEIEGVQGANDTAIKSSYDLGQEDLFKILMSQLNYQDPLEPMDNTQFLSDLAQFTQIEQTRQMGTALDDITKITSAIESINLLGKSVEVVEGDSIIIGEVVSMEFANGVPMLSVSQESGAIVRNVSLANIRAIK